ncbi:MAG TPA: peptidoglycan DD-metalloendopeptidase family protein [Woeseiaceae bacterium]|nr:peptidoglycan DD-metalloendopeptidase family protein [Woeseiaceae bacterium]
MIRAPVVTVLLAALLLAACGSGASWQAQPEQHIVRKGETLFSIAWRYGKDPKAVARWNRLGDGSLIYPGQVLRLTPPSGANRRSAPPGSRPALPSIPAQPPPAWGWPTRGSVGVEFGGKPGSGTGVLIDGRSGQPVVAAASGRVVYAGGGLIGYGQLIILKHNDTYLSAYGHNAKLLVKEGQAVRKGQQIATMGEGPERKPRLHFEIRRNGEPVNPRQYLPAR